MLDLNRLIIRQIRRQLINLHIDMAMCRIVAIANSESRPRATG
jgi:hypothetical protein